MNRQIVVRLGLGIIFLAGQLGFAQQAPLNTQAANPQQVASLTDSNPGGESSPAAPQSNTASSQASAASPQPSGPEKHKIGPLEVTVNWRTRAEGWYWFQGNTGNSEYGLWDSLLRVGIGQTGE